MTPPPGWVKQLRPSGTQGPELLQQERDRSSVSVGKLAELLHSKQALERQTRLLTILEPDPVFDKSQKHSLGRVERLKGSLAKAKRLHQLRVQYGWSFDEFSTANDLIGEPTVYGLHEAMFLVKTCGFVMQLSNRNTMLTCLSIFSENTA